MCEFSIVLPIFCSAFLLSEAAIEGTAEMSADERVNALRQRFLAHMDSLNHHF